MDAMETVTRPAEAVDQGRLPLFRLLLLVQVLAAGFFGLVPLAAPETFAAVFGYRGAEPFIYRLAGAATFGYAVVGLLGAARPGWRPLRIPLIGTFTFTIAAAAGCLISLGEGDASLLVIVVLVAATSFAALAAYWLYQDEGPGPGDGGRLEPGFRATIGLATVSAAVFGLVPLLMADAFADLFRLAPSDLVIYRLAGAATLGYAVAGVFQLLVNRWDAIRYQVVGAIAFNALAAVSAAIYLARGGTSLLGLVVLLAAGFFTFALTGWAARAIR